MQFAQPSPYCESGEFAGKSCRHMDMVSPQMVCPPEYQMESTGKSSKCKKSYTYTVKAPCPKGTTDNGKTCISYKMEAATHWCPEGTQMQGEWCLSWSSYDCTPSKAMPVIKKSKKKHGHGGHGHHHRRLGAKPHIMTPSKGKVTKTSIVSKMCEKEMKTPIVKKCPHGTMNMGKTCKSTIEHERGMIEKMEWEFAPVDAICPHPYEWCGGGKKHGHKGKASCCKSWEVEPMYKCPSGYFESKAGCERKSEPIFICPSEKKKHHGHGHGHGGQSPSGKDGCSRWEYAEPIRKITVTVQPSYKKKHGHGHHH